MEERRRFGIESVGMLDRPTAFSACAPEATQRRDSPSPPYKPTVQPASGPQHAPGTAMLDEHALQAAILASIRDPAPPARPTRLEPRQLSFRGPSHGAGGSFGGRGGQGPTVLRTSTSSRPRGRTFGEYAQMKRSLEQRQRAPSRAGPSGHRGALKREGILPAAGRRNQPSPAATGAPTESHSGESAFNGGDVARGRSDAGNNGHSVWRSTALGRGWTGHAERTRGLALRARAGSLRVCGLHTVVEAQGPGMFMCTHPVRGGSSFNLTAEVRGDLTERWSRPLTPPRWGACPHRSRARAQATRARPAVQDSSSSSPSGPPPTAAGSTPT